MEQRTEEGIPEGIQPITGGKGADEGIPTTTGVQSISERIQKPTGGKGTEEGTKHGTKKIRDTLSSDEAYAVSIGAK